jgi:CubicO group peptidase (beta-lactamase class C family)
MKNSLTIVFLCCLSAFAVVHAAGLPSDGSDFSFSTTSKDVGVPSSPGDPLLTGDCTDYVDLSGQPLPIYESGSTVGATNDYGPFSSQPACWTSYWDSQGCAGPDVTYKWTVPADGRYTISLCGSSYDTGLLLFNFTCPIEPSYPEDFICGNDDACGLASELHRVEFSAGQEILIVVDGYGNNAGTYQLQISGFSTGNPDSSIVSTMETYHVPGVSACAVHNGNMVWSGNYGYANIADSVEMTDSTLFLLASISKTFVGVALMQLWEDSLFGLDDSINSYLPWEVHNPYYPDSVITFRMLMTHTSGIADNWDVLTPLITWGVDSPIPLGEFLMNYLTPGGSYYVAGSNFTNHVPGTYYQYCNVGAALGGYLVERINPDSLSLEDYCQQHIFAPLGMNNTSWFLANLNAEDIAIPYRWNVWGYYSPYQHYGHPFYPCGFLRTSSSQLARHMTAFMQHGQIEGTRILDSTTVELMTTVQFPEVSPGFGLLWMTGSIGGGQSIWGHSGSYYGYRTQMWYCPENDIGVIVLTNGESDAGSEIVWYEVFDYVTQTLAAAEPQGTPSTPEQFALLQNYPNPFNPTTTIAFEQPKAGHISLGVFDLLGREVAVLKDGLVEAGTHRVTFDGSRLASGIYFARLDAGNFSQTKKLMLLK